MGRACHSREVRQRGVEPPRPAGHGRLRTACLPFHHCRGVHQLSTVTRAESIPGCSNTCSYGTRRLRRKHLESGSLMADSEADRHEFRGWLPHPDGALSKDTAAVPDNGLNRPDGGRLRCTRSATRTRPLDACATRVLATRRLLWWSPTSSDASGSGLELDSQTRRHRLPLTRACHVRLAVSRTPAASSPRRKARRCYLEPRCGWKDRSAANVASTCGGDAIPRLP
jgi:hypothetical protein